MNVTENLMTEHQLILGYINTLKEYASEGTDGELILKNGPLFVDFIQNFADRFHHAKEEDILFKHMEEEGILTHCNPLPQMLHEHDQGRQTVKAMLAALKHENPAEFCQAALSYGQLLEEHIYKEDNILYQMAEDGFSDEAKAELLKEYGIAEERLQSEKIWSHYKQQLEVLKEELHTQS